MENEQEQRRHRLHGLVDRYFHNDNDWIVGVIRQRTGENVSVRTIQSWLIQPSRRSSRNCPEWALKALEEYVQDPANAEIFQVRKDRYEASICTTKTPLIWSDEVRSSKAVDFATSELEEDSRNLSKLQEEFGSRQGSLIFELQKKLQNSIDEHGKTHSAIFHAMNSSKTFEECREKFLEEERANSHIHFVVREAKRAIETNTQEFADDGTV